MFKVKFSVILLGALLGGLAGVSLIISILPNAIDALGFTDFFTVRVALSDVTASGFALWAVGGANAIRFGSPKRGALIMGGVGLATGFLLAFFYLTRDPIALVAITLIAMGYGIGAGLLLGSIFRKK